MLIASGIILRILFVIIFKGASDPWNYESYIEFMRDGQSPFGIPYLPVFYLFGYLYSILLGIFGMSFSFWVRLGSLAADIGIIVLILGISKRLKMSDNRALAIGSLYALNPVAFQLTALHGQFDQFVFLFVLLAAYIEMADIENRGIKSFASLLCLLLATYVKPYAVLFFPVFLFRQGGRRQMMRYTGLYFLGILLSFLVLLDPRTIYRSMDPILRYSGGEGAGHLGWAGLFVRYKWAEGPLLLFSKITKPLLLCVAFLTGYYTRHRNALVSILLISLASIFISPGLASQYLYWVIPAGVFFAGRYFFLYSVMGFIWQLNFFQYLYHDQASFINYQQFVPLRNLGLFYNFWMFPEWLTYFVQYSAGYVLIPCVSAVWFYGVLRPSLKPGQKAGPLSRDRSAGIRYRKLLSALCSIFVLWLISASLMFTQVKRYPLLGNIYGCLSGKEEKAGCLKTVLDEYTARGINKRSYPKNIEFYGNKIDQYFLYGRNESLHDTFRINRLSGQYHIVVDTPEVYKTSINGEFVEFNWSSGYKSLFGTNRMYKKDPIRLNVTEYLKPGENSISIEANFSYERPDGNYIGYKLLNDNNIVGARIVRFDIAPAAPFYRSFTFILAMSSLLYFLYSTGKSNTGIKEYTYGADI